MASTKDPAIDQANEVTSSNRLSIVDALKAPTLLDRTWKRKVDINPPPRGKQQTCGEEASKPKTVTPAQRVWELPEERSAVSGTGGPSCFVNMTRGTEHYKNIIVSHIASNKHKTGKSELAQREARERDIARLLKEAYIRNSPSWRNSPYGLAHILSEMRLACCCPYFEARTFRRFAGGEYV